MIILSRILYACHLLHIFRNKNFPSRIIDIKDYSQ